MYFVDLPIVCGPFFVVLLTCIKVHIVHELLADHVLHLLVNILLAYQFKLINIRLKCKAQLLKVKEDEKVCYCHKEDVKHDVEPAVFGHDYFPVRVNKMLWQKIKGHHKEHHEHNGAPKDHCETMPAKLTGLIIIFQI